MKFDNKELHQFFKEKNQKTDKPVVNLEDELNKLGYSLETAPPRNVLYSKVKTYIDHAEYLKRAKFFEDNTIADVYGLLKYDEYFNKFETPILLTDFIDKLKQTPFYSKEEVEKFTRLSVRCEKKKRDNSYTTVVVRRKKEFIPEICEQQIENDLDFLARLKYLKENYSR